ncbi:MAG: McrC family protein [Anaerolineaceae bacterium]
MESLKIESQELIRLKLKEWQEVSPEIEPKLINYRFSDPLARRSSQRLNKAKQLNLLELPAGLTINTFQFVGNIQLANLRIAILPKITGLPLLNLLRYAYNLRNLDLFEPLDFGAEECEFQDLLIQQLAVEVSELIQRGLFRKYEQIEEDLSSPSGKINFSSIAHQGGLIDASLPCNHFLRLEDNILNRTILAGLNFATTLTNDLSIKTHLRRTSQILGQIISRLPLSSQLFNKANLFSNRQTFAYKPALTIIQILLESQGVSLEETHRQVNLPGFLFDMNRFFQALIGHFLKDNLEGYTIKAEYQLRNMISYDPLHNPQNKKGLIPRPDFAIMEGNKLKVLLDTKYRDLWETELPREMLYQLALYAFSQNRPGESTILYPCLQIEAKESWLDIFHPLTGEKMVTIKLRPINLYALEDLILKGSAIQRKAFAHAIVFGENNRFR